MYEDRGIYDNIEYVEGIPEAFIYAFTMESSNPKHEPVELFNGFITENTISRQTLEKILKKKVDVLTPQRELKAKLKRIREET